MIVCRVKMAIRSNRNTSSRGVTSIVSKIERNGLLSNKPQMPMLTTSSRCILDQNNNKIDDNLVKDMFMQGDSTFSSKQSNP